MSSLKRGKGLGKGEVRERRRENGDRRRQEWRGEQGGRKWPGCLSEHG